MSATPARSGRQTSALRLLVAQVRSQLQQFVRLPIALFFTIGLPLIMLLIFGSIFGDTTVEMPQGDFPLDQFYVGGLAAFSAVSATFTNLVNMIPDRRQEGILRRWRGTPLAPAIYLAGYVVASVIIALFAVVLMIVVGVVIFGTELDPAKLPAAIATFVVGVAAWSALGVGLAGIVRSPESAPAVANAVILPLGFISDTFVSMEGGPKWLQTLGDVFPLKPFATSMQDVFNPLVDAPAFNGGRLAVMAAWGVIGALLAARCFKWDPVADSRGRSSRGRRGRRQGDTA